MRKNFPHLLSLRREEAERSTLGATTGSSGVKTRGTAELFGDFYRDVKGCAMNDPQAGELAAALDELERARREAVLG